MQRCQPLEIYEYHQAPLSNHSDWLNGKKKLFYRPVYGVSFGKFKILEFHLSCFVADAATTPRKQRYLALVPKRPTPLKNVVIAHVFSSNDVPDCNFIRRHENMTTDSFTSFN